MSERRLVLVDDTFRARDFVKTLGHMYPALVALGDAVTPADVRRLAPNHAWNVDYPRICDACGAETDRLVRFGQREERDDSEAHVCRSCVRAALELFGP